jgi:V/A-type H+-transporting ATPase subunit B
MRFAELIRYRKIVAIVGDLVRVDVGASVRGVARLGELARISEPDGLMSLAQVVRIDGDVASLQVFGGAQGLSTRANVTFLGRDAQAIFGPAILGRVLSGLGDPIDGRPSLGLETRICASGAVANPMRRSLPARMIRTDIPMIDVFNTLVESQKIPIFSVSGEPYNELLARVGVQAAADVVVLVGLGLSYDDYHQFRTAFEAAGVGHRTVMFVNFASDPIIERLLAPDLGLAVAERFAVEEKRRVLVLMSDMTAFADALKEIGVALERIPAHRGYMGDLYSQLARRYERACAYRGGGSVTVMTVTTMPGHDVTHPAPDNTGYITEGQIYLHDGKIDPFGSLSRLKQRVVGHGTREDHPHVMNAMIRLYAEGEEAKHKAAMAFDLSAYDQRLLEFSRAFEMHFMRVDCAMSLEAALDLGWRLMARWFTRDEIRIKPAIMDRFHPDSLQAAPT